ncbi:urease accessory protein [Sphingobacterium siyangense]|uniref:Urease accessory protein n=2 Tax=Sphingobacterium siyangense TaxID=459529 RepID=A0A562MET8_9SPHI|nr:urease accessory protein [Sphingobacterium siyangense]
MLLTCDEDKFTKMNKLPIPIDKIVANKAFALSEVDQLHLEWYEVHKRRLTRNTINGKAILMQLDQGAEWHHGDGLFHQETLQAILVVKPSLTIRFNPTDLVQLADFGYFIGNRHLPIFNVTDAESLRLPYDGRLYEQVLAKYGTSIQLEEALLLSEDLIRLQAKNKKNPDLKRIDGHISLGEQVRKDN